jgi:hypothetical protein
MDSSSSRRSFIGGAGLLVGGSLMSAAAIATAPPAEATNARLLRLIALHDRAEAECERFDAEVEVPARQACAAAIRALPAELPPPHEQSATTFVNVFGDTVRLSTENVGITAVARRVINDPSWVDMGDDDWRQAHREIAAAGDRREAVLAGQAARRKALEEQTRASFRIAALAARSNSLVDRRDGLWRAVITMPAATLADVITKLDFIDRTTQPSEIDGDMFAGISADIRHLAGEA